VLVASLVLLLPGACAFPGSVRPTIKVGLVAPFEGRYRYVGYDVIYAARLALWEANDRDGFSGYGVQLVAYDDGALPDMAQQQARKLAADPAVVGVLGHFRESTTAAAREAYLDAGLPLVAPTALDPDLCRVGAAIHCPGPSAIPLAQAMVDRIAPYVDDDRALLVADQRPLAAALERVGHERGLPLVRVSSDGDAWRKTVLARRPSVLLVALDPVRAGEVAAAFRETGWTGQLVGGPALAASDFTAVAGPAAQGALFVTPWPFPHHTSNGDAFAIAYREQSDRVEPGPYALPTYEAAWLLLNAVEHAAKRGRPTGASVARALTEVRQEGRLGPLSSSGGSAGEGALYWYRIAEGGTPILLEDD
jgi:branched-chain amino acid transport system substrate-binding protein